jgi:hypothetical protein
VPYKTSHSVFTLFKRTKRKENKIVMNTTVVLQSCQSRVIRYKSISVEGLCVETIHGDSDDTWQIGLLFLLQFSHMCSLAEEATACTTKDLCLNIFISAVLSWAIMTPPLAVSHYCGQIYCFWRLSAAAYTSNEMLKDTHTLKYSVCTRRSYL